MTGIFFGSTMGTTEAVAADIAKQLGVADADVHNVADTPAGEVQKYDLLVLGSSTWGAGELQDDWYGFLDQLKAQDLSGKKVALFGCGDSGSYPDTFCDAVGLIYDGLQQSSGSTKVTSIPSFFIVTPNRLYVPPYMHDELTKWSPAWQMLNIA